MGRKKAGKIASAGRGSQRAGKTFKETNGAIIARSDGRELWEVGECRRSVVVGYTLTSGQCRFLRRDERLLLSGASLLG